MNEFQVVGRLAKPAYVGEKVARITLAVQRGFKAKGAENYKTDFFDIVFFDTKKFGFIEKMEKGKSFAVTGHIQGERPRKDGEGYEDQQLIGRTLNFANGGNLATFQLAGSIGNVFDNGNNFATAKIYMSTKYNDETIYDTYSVSVNGIFAKHMVERNGSKQGITISGPLLTSTRKATNEAGEEFNKTVLVLSQEKQSWGDLRHEEGEAAEAKPEAAEEKPKEKVKKEAKAAEPVEAEDYTVAEDDLPF